MFSKDEFMRYYNLNENDWNNTAKHFQIMTFPNNFTFLKQGQIADKIGFLISGILRTFVWDNDGNDITTNFFQPGAVVLSAESFNNQTPAKENIATLDECTISIIDFKSMKQLYEEIPVWRTICKDFADNKGKELTDRALQFQTMSASERYENFCKQNPEIIKKVALKHIASYLGIDIATLSRIRKKV